MVPDTLGKDLDFTARGTVRRSRFALAVLLFPLALPLFIVGLVPHALNFDHRGLGLPKDPRRDEGPNVRRAIICAFWPILLPIVVLSWWLTGVPGLFTRWLVVFDG